MQGSQDLSLPRQQQEMRLPETDAEGLASYLHLLTQIFSTASVSDVESWISQLEASIKKQPLWAIFFQLMCHPVPQVSLSSDTKSVSSPMHKSPPRINALHTRNQECLVRDDSHLRQHLAWIVLHLSHSNKSFIVSD